MASRRRETQLIRFVIATLALVALVFLYVTMRANDMPPHQVSPLLFGWIAGISFFFCNLAGVRLTADTLSEEKRNGTLGLLFLTDLRGYDVVLGKMITASLKSFYGVLAVLPHVDDFVAGHSLATYAELCEVIARA